MNRILPLLSFLLPLSVLAQRPQLEVFLKPGYSHIPDQVQSQRLNVVDVASGFTSIWVNQGTLTDRYKSRLGVETGVSAKFVISVRFYLQGSMGGALTRFQRTRSVDAVTDGEITLGSIVTGTPIGSIFGGIDGGQPGNFLFETSTNEKLGETNLVHLQLPVHAGYQVTPKLQLEGGLLTSMTLWSAVFSQGELYYSNGAYTKSEDYWKHSDNGFSRWTLSASARASYLLAPHWTAFASYQHGLTSLFSDNYVGTPRVQSFSIGGAYILSTPRNQ